MSGRQLIGQIVRDEIYRRGLDQKSFAEQMNVSRSTITRIVGGEEAVSEMNLRMIEGALDLPRGFLDYVGERDVNSVRESGADEDLVRWTIERIENDDASNQGADVG